jgi:hypothetical protein
MASPSRPLFRRGTTAAFLILGLLTALAAVATPAQADIWQSAHDATCNQGHCVNVYVGGLTYLCGDDTGFMVWAEVDGQGIRVYYPTGLNSGHWTGWCYA